MPDRVDPEFYATQAMMRLDIAIAHTPREFWLTNDPKHISSWRSFAFGVRPSREGAYGHDEHLLFRVLMDRLKTDIMYHTARRNTEAVLRAQDRFNFILAMRLVEVRDG